VTPGHPDATGLNCNEIADKLFPDLLNNGNDGGREYGPCIGRKSSEQNAGRRLRTREDKAAKVPILGDQYPLFLESQLRYGLIFGAPARLTFRLDVVACSPQGGLPRSRSSGPPGTASLTCPNGLVVAPV